MKIKKMSNKIKIIVAKNAGFCFGVKRAVDMAQENLGKKGERQMFCLGHLIHNPIVVKDLQSKGLKVVDDPENIEKNSLVLIRSHGVAPQVIEKVKAKGAEIIDATCPFVKSAQNIAKKYYQEGYQVVICGDPSHAEVIGINGYTDNNAIIAQEPADLANTGEFPKMALLSQTTQKKENFRKIAAALMDHTKELVIKNTICSDTSVKQNELIKISKKADLMIIIGGKNSSNTTKLFQLSKKEQPNSFHIEEAAEFKKEWLKGVSTVGIGAGASTPQELIDQLVEKIRD